MSVRFRLVVMFESVVRNPAVAGPFDLIFQDGDKQLYTPLLERLVADGRLTASAAVGFWPANAVGDDIAGRISVTAASCAATRSRRSAAGTPAMKSG